MGKYNECAKKNHLYNYIIFDGRNFDAVLRFCTKDDGQSEAFKDLDENGTHSMTLCGEDFNIPINVGDYVVNISGYNDDGLGIGNDTYSVLTKEDFEKCFQSVMKKDINKWTDRQSERLLHFEKKVTWYKTKILEIIAKMNDMVRFSGFEENNNPSFVEMGDGEVTLVYSGKRYYDELEEEKELDLNEVCNIMKMRGVITPDDFK